MRYRPSYRSAEALTLDGSLDSLLTSLADPGRSASGVVEWSGWEGLRVLDLDWHASRPPSDPSRIVRSLPPPAAWWVSRSGGLHLLYEPHEETTADTYAALSAIRALALDHVVAAEILTRSRVVPAGQELHRCTQQTGLHDLASWAEGHTVDHEAVDDWLGDHGLTDGRHDHIVCPWDPRPNAAGGVPVVVSDTGIVCWVCGIRRSWAEMLGTVDDTIVRAAKTLVPWAAVRHLMRQRWTGRAADKVLRAAYLALVQFTHTKEDPRPGMISADWPYLRVDGGWIAEKSGASCRPSRPAAKELAYCTGFRRAEDGTIKTPKSETRTDLLTQPGQAPPEWPVHTVTKGVTLWYEAHELGKQQVLIRADGSSPYAYIPASQRVPLDEVWSEIEQDFPGIDRKYLTLLLVARAWAESGRSMVPVLLVSGSSGAGKSVVPRFAAELLDGLRIGVRFSNSRLTLEQLLGDAAAQNADYLVIDEVAKGTPRDKILNFLSPLLLTGRDVTFHRLYEGTQQMPLRSCIVLTDTHWPLDVLQDVQIGRRMIRVHLTKRVPDWHESARIDGWRARHLRAAQSLTSWIVDEYLGGYTSFARVSQAIGFSTVERSIDATETPDAIRELYRLVCLNDLGETDGRWKGPGWVVIDQAIDSEIRTAWEVLCDSGDAGYYESRRCSEADISSIVGSKVPCVLDPSRPHGRKFAIRFREAVDGTTAGLVNRELAE